MSRHIYRTRTRDGRDVVVTLGYDRPLDYVFCTVFDGQGEIVYSNLSDEEAGTDQQDVSYFKGILLELRIRVPERVFAEVRGDQLRGVGNRTVDHDVSDPVNRVLDWPHPRSSLRRVFSPNRVNSVRLEPAPFYQPGFDHILTIIGRDAASAQDYCSSFYRKWENRVAKPLLKRLGYSGIRFSTDDSDTLGPVTRIVSARKNGENYRFIYG